MRDDLDFTAKVGHAENRLHFTAVNVFRTAMPDTIVREKLLPERPAGINFSPNLRSPSGEEFAHEFFWRLHWRKIPCCFLVVKDFSAVGIGVGCFIFSFGVSCFWKEHA